FESTWTCYVGGELHCGACSACNERKRAFTESGIKDPTEYKN
ncbi:MAG: 7-cyano-7-deazaguanine synthase, partial [Thermodesulfobacteriota bacterium]